MDHIRDFVQRLDFSLDDDEALILMGHGSDHDADWVYQALEDEYVRSGKDRIFLATVEGSKELGEAIEKIKSLGLKKVVLRPFMIVAGDHARNDMAGEDEDSWKMILEKEGFIVKCILQGLGEFKEVQDMYIERTKDLLENK